MTTLTNLDKLAMLVSLDEDEAALEEVKDRLDTAYYFYRNGFVEVDRAGYRLRPYEELPGLLWKDQIIQRDFVKLLPAEVEKGDYWQFANNIADNYIDKETGKRRNPERFISFLTITGYNLHRFFETKLRCTVLLDSRVTNDDEPDGRSGKSLHCKALREILNADPRNGKQCVIIDGKRYDENNRFNLDELHLTTNLVIFDDIKRSFLLENFFNSIPDGLIRERKGDINKVRVLAKIIFTLNYTLKVHGGSAKDRVIEFEIADYYSEKFSPEMEFGRWMFRDWDAEEYARFDNFMMMAVHEYFRLGVLLPSSINLDVRKLRNDTAPEFIAFMQDLDIQHLQVFNKKELFGKFLKEIEVGGDVQRHNDLKFVNQRVFTKFLRLWAQYRPEIAGYCEYRSNSNDFIRFFHNEPVPEAEKAKLEGAVLFPHKSKHVAIEAAPVAATDEPPLPF
jgi:predicted amino acid-binding ACT domain protein